MSRLRTRILTLKTDWSLWRLPGSHSSIICLPLLLMSSSNFVTKSLDSMISARKTGNFSSDRLVSSFSPFVYPTGKYREIWKPLSKYYHFSCRTLPHSMKLTFCNGTVLHRQQVKSTFGDWLQGITELSKSLQAIDIDASAYACLSALTLVNGNQSALNFNYNLTCNFQSATGCSSRKKLKIYKPR